jgi:hypothetical protein
MRRSIAVLLGLALAGSAQIVAAQDPPSRTLRVVSPVPDQEVSFRVQVDASAAPSGQTLQLRSSSAVYRRGDHLDIGTPAEFLLSTEAPFQVSFSAASAAEPVRLLIAADGQDLQISGTRVVLARDTDGAPVYLKWVEAGEVRRIPSPQLRR